MTLYVIDTNVILLAGTNVRDIPKDQIDVFRKCVLFVHDAMNSGIFILMDDERRVITEYENAYRIDGYPNNAAVFLEYVFGHARFIHLDEIDKNVFKTYPDDFTLRNFDPPDRKFIALAYACDLNPPIIEATDSKWWGIVDDLKRNNIEIQFIDEKYIREKYIKKMVQ